MIDKTLKKLNFSEKEIDIYLAILKNGKIIPSDLAHVTGINRSTVYSVVSDLEKKKVITHDLSGPIKYVVALPPEDLENLVKDQEKKIQTQKKLIKKAVSELQSFTTGTKYTVPKIRFIPEEDLENFINTRADEWDRSLLETEACWYGYQDHTYVEHYSHLIDYYWSRAHEDMQLRLVTNESDIERTMEDKEYKKKRIIKFLKKKGPFTSSIWVVGDYTVILYTNQRPHYVIEIKNAELAKNQRELFKFVWEVV